MKFRPCIDIHNGKVKQIVGGSLKDEGDMAQTNFTSEQDAAWYAENITGWTQRRAYHSAQLQRFQIF